MAKSLAVIAGVGPGLGKSLALKFASEYKIVLLSRTQEKLDRFAEEIKSQGGDAVGISVDIDNEESVTQAFQKIKELGPVNVAVYNASGGGKDGFKYFRAPFLTIPPDVFESFWRTSTKGGFLFAQQALPLLVETAKTETKYPPTLVFTGATASIKGSINFSAFASAKHALRAMSQSIAKEFGPQGVHVAHVVADGGFDTPRRKEMQPDANEETLMSTDGMAESYWALHTQPKRAWSWEIDLRPYLVTIPDKLN